MEETYCTVSEVTTYATANGERGWNYLGTIDIAGAVNLVAGYGAGVRTMAVDGFADAVNPISQGDKFTIASDSTATVYTVQGSQFQNGTIEITFSPGLAESVANDDAITFTSSQATDEQTRAVVKATKDIVRYHKQLNPDGSLWNPTSDDLNKAAILQSIYLAKVMGMRDRATVLKEMTSTSFDDGEIVIQNINGPQIDPDAEFLIKKCMNENWEWIESNAEAFGRRPGAYYGR